MKWWVVETSGSRGSASVRIFGKGLIIVKQPDACLFGAEYRGGCDGKGRIIMDKGSNIVLDVAVLFCKRFVTVHSEGGVGHRRMS